jgi:serine/threonine protein phosphatase PrpC
MPRRSAPADGGIPVSDDAFNWIVVDAHGEVCGRRRSEADARALVRMLERASPKRGPYSYTGPQG